MNIRPLLFSLPLITLSAVAFADVRQELFTADKQAALAGFTQAEKNRCMVEFTHQSRASYRLAGPLEFSETVSSAVYDVLYWQGQGKVRRGVAFTAPLATNKSDRRSGALLVCYFAMTDSHLAFQSAHIIPAREVTLINASLGKEAH